MDRCRDHDSATRIPVRSHHLPRLMEGTAVGVNSFTLSGVQFTKMHKTVNRIHSAAASTGTTGPASN